MSLIKCPECGKEISDKAKSCPNCGYKNRKINIKLLITLLCGIIVIASILFIVIKKPGGILTNKKNIGQKEMDNQVKNKSDEKSVSEEFKEPVNLDVADENYTKAVAHMEKEDYEAATYYLKACQNYKDSEKLLKECYYLGGIKFYKEFDYNKAKEFFDYLTTDYEDTEIYLKKLEEKFKYSKLDYKNFGDELNRAIIYLNEILKNPESLQINNIYIWGYMKNIEIDRYIVIDYSAQNGFGGMNREDIIFSYGFYDGAGEIDYYNKDIDERLMKGELRIKNDVIYSGKAPKDLLIDILSEDLLKNL